MPGDEAGHLHLVRAVRANNDADKVSSERLRLICDEEEALRSEKDPGLIPARSAQTAIVEEEQYLLKISEQLLRANRESKVAEATTQIDADLLAFQSATGPNALALAKRLAAAEDRADTLAHSEYVKPWTLPDQIQRSLACVFLASCWDR